MSIVPDLVEQLVDGVDDLGQPARLFRPFELEPEILKHLRRDVAQHLGERNGIGGSLTEVRFDIGMRLAVIAMRIAEVLRVVRDEGKAYAGILLGRDQVGIGFNDDCIIDPIPLPVEGARFSIARCAARNFTASVAGMTSAAFNNASMRWMASLTADPKVTIRWSMSSSCARIAARFFGLPNLSTAPFTLLRTPERLRPLSAAMRPLLRANSSFTVCGTISAISPCRTNSSSTLRRSICLRSSAMPIHTQVCHPTGPIVAKQRFRWSPSQLVRAAINLSTDVLAIRAC